MYFAITERVFITAPLPSPLCLFKAGEVTRAKVLWESEALDIIATQTSDGVCFPPTHIALVKRPRVTRQMRRKVREDITDF